MTKARESYSTPEPARAEDRDHRGRGRRVTCDPDAMQAELVAEGTAAGTCSELQCALSADVTVNVGICLPP